MRVLRVFPRRTRATPDDADVVVGRSPTLWDQADRVDVSVTFEWDKERAERLAEKWAVVAPTTVGGPAYGDPGGEFVPGKYLKRGYVITSRGCPGACKHCLVPGREGGLRVLGITDGWDVLDNNLLACPRGHVAAVFDMLERQPEPAKFTGGLEARRLEAWHVERLARLRPDAIWMAYDREIEWEPLAAAVAMLREAGLVARWRRKRVGAYVLMGWAGDTPDEAEKRLRRVIFGLEIKTQAMLLDNGRECDPSDLPRWWWLRKQYTSAASVGAMVMEAWESSKVREC